MEYPWYLFIKKEKKHNYGEMVQNYVNQSVSYHWVTKLLGQSDIKGHLIGCIKNAKWHSSWKEAQDKLKLRVFLQNVIFIKSRAWNLLDHVIENWSQLESTSCVQLRKGLAESYIIFSILINFL